MKQDSGQWELRYRELEATLGYLYAGMASSAKGPCKPVVSARIKEIRKISDPEPALVCLFVGDSPLVEFLQLSGGKLIEKQYSYSNTVQLRAEADCVVVNLFSPAGDVLDASEVEIDAKI
ncbi:hypothetical protein J8246_07800 [Corynebacterium tuberculostearicum]|uniref:hypothetical protein n=1 Tax=Corynebacterium TaxID=1716 RepID=UPI00195CBB0E|nr:MULTISPECIES: hypothetical protein [Corynebacterium]MCG7465740.1 hypothetical protein [Corynebacterium sp. ACRPJ]QRQ68159.1 hypothetical protein I6J28_05570 [Corynebacterium tuberculostearicum]WKE52308.1 hypothetical protein J8246_07800 [Corynebacterium tuberculostearicum]